MEARRSPRNNMANFDFTANRQAPDYTQILQAIQQRAQTPNTLNAGLGAVAQNLGPLVQRMQQKKKQQQMFSQLSQIPELAQLAGPISQNPELLGQLGPALLKPQKPSAEYSAVGGELSPEGQTLVIDKFSGDVRPSGPKGSKSTGYGASMGPIRKAQYTLQDLPSNQGPSTAAGAAYQVKVAARQGKSLVAKAGSAQRTGAASGDLGRAVMRAAPTDEALKNLNFSDNLATRWSFLKQKLTADPGYADNPKVRKEIYSIFNEMDQSSQPWIANQLDYMEEVGFPISKKMRSKQLGENLPDIPFIDLPGGQPGQNPGAPSQSGKATLRWNPQTNSLDPVP